MATELFKDTIEAGDSEDIAVTNLGRFGLIWRDGPLQVAMLEPHSGLPVPVNNGAEAYGSYVGDMVGVTLRLTAGPSDVNVTVYEE